MIVPDVNLIVYAYNADAGAHRRAKEWETCLSGSRPVGLTWVVLLGYIRLMTSRKVLIDPFSISEVFGHLRSWLERPQVELLHPGPRHLDLLLDLASAAQASGDLVTDLHLAALAIEHQAELCSNDADFARFPGLRWTNPLL
jgi:toxin-antitoxin system PIN domain toxin